MDCQHLLFSIQFSSVVQTAHSHVLTTGHACVLILIFPKTRHAKLFSKPDGKTGYLLPDIIVPWLYYSQFSCLVLGKKNPYRPRWLKVMGVRRMSSKACRAPKFFSKHFSKPQSSSTLSVPQELPPQFYCSGYSEAVSVPQEIMSQVF